MNLTGCIDWSLINVAPNCEPESIITLVFVNVDQTCDVCSPHHETRRIRRGLLVQEEEQAPASLGQNMQSDRSRSQGCADLGGGQQAPGRSPHHCPGRTMAYSVNKDLRQWKEHIVKPTSKKTGRYEVGRATAHESVRLRQDK